MLLFPLQLFFKHFSLYREFCVITSWTYIGLHVKYPLFLSDFNDDCIFRTYFQKILQYQISWKSVLLELSCYMRTSRWMDGWIDGSMDTHIKKLVVAFHNFAKKGIKIPPKDLCTWWSLSLTNYLSGCLRNTELQNAKFIIIQCETPPFMSLQLLCCSAVYTSFSTWCSYMR